MADIVKKLNVICDTTSNMECLNSILLSFVGARVCESEHRMTRAHWVNIM